MSLPLLIDTSHTSHTQARTGIQRVTRSLCEALAQDAVPITYDPYARKWRTLAPWETANLSGAGIATKRGARWPLRARIRGTLARWLAGRPPRAELPAGSGVVVPELFSPTVAAALPMLPADGPRIALFHDAIALRLPELTPGKTVARFPSYLQELLAFDGIAAVSEDSRATLLDYWHWLGIRRVPAVRAIPLGIEIPNDAVGDAPPRAVPTVLSVGSIEGRKNQLALLEACESLWSRGEKFELRLIGLANSETGAAAVRRIGELQAGGRPLRYDGPTDEATLQNAYRECAFTVYPSLMEGFGLPVLESLSHGKPCVCAASGALGEAACGGGCLTLDRVDASSLAASIHELLADASRRQKLARDARGRTFRSWRDYANDLVGWCRELAGSRT